MDKSLEARLFSSLILLAGIILVIHFFIPNMELKEIKSFPDEYYVDRQKNTPRVKVRYLLTFANEFDEKEYMKKVPDSEFPDKKNTIKTFYVGYEGAGNQYFYVGFDYPPDAKSIKEELRKFAR